MIARQNFHLEKHSALSLLRALFLLIETKAAHFCAAFAFLYMAMCMRLYTVYGLDLPKILKRSISQPIKKRPPVNR